MWAAMGGEVGTDLKVLAALRLKGVLSIKAGVRAAFGSRVRGQEEGETRLKRLDLGCLDLPL